MLNITLYLLLIFNLLIIMKHPIHVLLIIVWFSFVIAIFSGYAIGFWYNYSIVLLFLGGLIVVFLYIVILMANTKFVYYDQNMGQWITSFSLLVWFSSFVENTNMSDMFYYLYSTSNFALLCVILNLLFLSLFIVVNISESFNGALVNNF